MRLKEFLKNYSRENSQLAQPFVIAEAGVNHEGRMDWARRLIEEAKEGGADAIKFQTYKAETIAMRNSPSYWDTTKEPTRSQFELFKKYDKFGKDEFEQLKMYCDKIGIEFLSTPFDVESAKFLNPLMEVYKISSSDITNKPFIEFMCGFGKPILLSVGASDMGEIKEAVGWIESKGNPLALLHCVLNYPTEDQNTNLGKIRGLLRKFPGRVIGYSDHTVPADMKALEIATLLGATVLEKHFTFDKTLPGNDHYHAMDKEDLKIFRGKIARDILFYGRETLAALLSEAPARANARRSLVAARDIPKGKKIELSDLTWKRPACGLSPKEIDRVVGRRAAINIVEDSPIQWDMLE